MKITVLVGFCLMITNCAEENFLGDARQANTESRLASADLGEPGDSEVADTEISEDPSQKETTPLEEENPSEKEIVQATEPVMVGGAFLVCHALDDFYCRIDTQQDTNIKPDPKFMPQFWADGQLTDFQLSERNDWTWKIDSSVQNVQVIALHLLYNGQTLHRYETTITNQPLQIGDGTNALQGCTNDTLRDALLTGLTYDREFTVKSSQSIAVTITGLCGVARPNDSKVDIFDANEQIVATKFLPNTPTTIDYLVEFETIPAGSYTLRISAGDDIDIDDLFISGLSISPISNN